MTIRRIGVDILLIGCGFAIGGLVSKMYFQKKYTEQARVEIQAIRELYFSGEMDKELSKTYVEEEPPENSVEVCLESNDKNLVDSFKRMDQIVVDYTSSQQPIVDSIEFSENDIGSFNKDSGVYVIEKSQFKEMPYYDVMDIEYYSDDDTMVEEGTGGVIFDDGDVVNAVGSDPNFKEEDYEELYLYVVNHRAGKYYRIRKIDGAYEDFYPDGVRR